MDLGRKSQFSSEERLEIAQKLQLVLLDEISRNARWHIGDAAFHGGTSINSVWNSHRWSEDLDFLLSSDLRSALVSAVPKVAAATRLRMELEYPGCAIEFGVREGGKGEQDRMDVWHVKWGHANRIGKVLVKAEFYSTAPDLMAAYQATLARPAKHGASISSFIPVGDLKALWADKAKAIATREAFKWRDAHDFAYIAESIDRRGWPEPEELTESLTTSAAIYGKCTDDIVDGLRRCIGEGYFQEVRAFTADMEKWFPSALHADFEEQGLFKQMLVRAQEEAERAITLASVPSAEARP